MGNDMQVLIEQMTMKYRLLFVFLLFVILGLGVFLRFQAQTIPYRHGPDEMVYASRAAIINQAGVMGSQAIVQQFNNVHENWFYPSPTRVGQTWLIIAMIRGFHLPALQAGIRLSLFAGIGALFLFVLFGWRFLNPWALLVGLLFYSVSPVSIAMTHRCLQPALVEFFGLLMIYFFGESVRSRGASIWTLLFVIAGGYSILIKISLFAFYLLLAGILFLFLLYQKQFRHFFYFCFFGLISLIAVFVQLVYWTGGLHWLIASYTHVKVAMPHNAYAIQFQTGPWYQPLQLIWMTSLFGSIFYLIFPFLMVFSQFREKCQNLFLMNLFWLAGLVFMLLSMTATYCQNLRYYAMLFPILYFISGTAFVLVIENSLAKGIRKLLMILLVLFCLLIFAGRDYLFYDKLFAGHPFFLYDPSALAVKQLNQLNLNRVLVHGQK